MSEVKKLNDIILDCNEARRVLNSIQSTVFSEKMTLEEKRSAIDSAARQVVGVMESIKDQTYLIAIESRQRGLL